MQGQSRIPILVCLSLFLSVFLFTARGYGGGDHFLSYMTAESIVLNRSLCCSPDTRWCCSTQARPTEALLGAPW